YDWRPHVRDGGRGSPDGQHIAYWQFDTAGVGIFALIDDTAASYPHSTRYAYPKVGTTNSAVRIGVVASDPEGSPRGQTPPTRWMQTPGDPRNSYLSRLGRIDATTPASQPLN